MRKSTQMMSLLLPLLLLGLLATAVIAFYRIRAYGLPISIVTATATMLLPIITGAGVQRSLAQSASYHISAKSSISWLNFVAFMLLIIYDTVIATLALTHMAPPNSLTCPLEQRWSQFFSSKNAAVIQLIQERHQCCGFRNARDRAWPFPDRSHTATSCADTFGRQRGCLGGWRQDMQVTAGMMLIVAITLFLLKLGVLVLYRTRNPFVAAAWRGPSNAISADGESEPADDERRGNNVRGQIEDAYHDEVDDVQSRDPHVDDASGGGTEGPVMQPSRLHHDANAWRED